MNSSVTVFLITIASLLMVGAIGELLFVRTRIPDAIWLILVGVFLRISGIVDAETLAAITPYFAAVTLIIVLFDGGSRLRIADIAQAAGRGAVLALATFLFTMLVVALFSVGIAALGVLPEWSFVHGLMLGAIVGGSSSLILMPSLKLAGVKGRIANLVNIESALTDALCAVFTVAFVDVLITGSASAGATLATLAKSFGIALGLGALLGWGWIPAMRLLRGSSYAYPFTLAGLMLLYVLVDVAGGSPAMGVLAFSIVVGNARSFTRWLHDLGPDQSGVHLDGEVQAVHSQISFIVKSLFFTFLGLMLSPPWSLLIMGIVLGVVLLLARIPAVFVALRGAGLSARDHSVAYVCLPRGMAAGALATLPFLAGVPGTEGVPTLVFASVITSIVIFTIGFRRVYGAGAGASAPAIVEDEDAGAELPSAAATAAAAPIATSPASEVSSPAAVAVEEVASAPVIHARPAAEVTPAAPGEESVESAPALASPPASAPSPAPSLPPASPVPASPAAASPPASAPPLPPASPSPPVRFAPPKPTSADERE
ncbi:MAG: cation:proton antiporter [Myxococcales bacterium]|nr:cation:proton antiporter [Myxococcales bacterium]